MEFVITEVQTRVDWLERFKVNIDLPLFSFRRDDFSTVDDESIRRNLVVELQSLLC